MTEPAASFTLFTAEEFSWFWSFVHPESPVNVSRLKMFPCSMLGKMYTDQLVPSPALGHGPPANGRPSADPADGKNFFVSWKVCSARPICLRLFWHCARAAASRTFCTAGTNRPMRMAMIAITTSNSINVNPRPRPGFFTGLRIRLMTTPEKEYRWRERGPDGRPLILTLTLADAPGTPRVRVGAAEVVAPCSAKLISQPT